MSDTDSALVAWQCIHPDAWVELPHRVEHGRRERQSVLVEIVGTVVHEDVNLLTSTVSRHVVERDLLQLSTNDREDCRTVYPVSGVFGKVVVVVLLVILAKIRSQGDVRIIVSLKAVQISEEFRVLAVLRAHIDDGATLRTNHVDEFRVAKVSEVTHAWVSARSGVDTLAGVSVH